MRHFFKLTFFFIFCLVAILVYDKAVEGFSTRQVRTVENFNVSIKPTHISDQLIRNICQQPLIYLGKGCQFYAFETIDQKYVVKFFKQKHLRNKNWLLNIPAPPFIKNNLESKISCKQQKVDKLLSSCKIAYEELPELTGVVAIHLNKTNHLNTRMTLVNKLGMRREIKADHVEFIVQKKAIAAKEYLTLDLSNEEIITFLEKFEASLKAFSQKGIKDMDKAVIQNLAYLPHEKEILFIDFGQYEFNEEIKNPENLRIEMLARLNSIMEWAKKECPKIIPLIKQRIATYSR